MLAFLPHPLPGDWGPPAQTPGDQQSAQAALCSEPSGGSDTIRADATVHAVPYEVLHELRPPSAL